MELETLILSAGFTGLGLGAILYVIVAPFALAIFLAALALHLLLLVQVYSRKK